MDEPGKVEAITRWLTERYPERIVAGPDRCRDSVECWRLLKAVGYIHTELISVLGIQRECFTGMWSAEDIVEAVERKGGADELLVKGTRRLLVSRSNALVLDVWDEEVEGE